jgi:hypothetical protein
MEQDWAKLLFPRFVFCLLVVAAASDRCQYKQFINARRLSRKGNYH